MGQVPAVRQVKPQNSIPGVQACLVNGSVGLGAGMWLHVGEFGSEEFLGPVDGQLLNLVDDLASPVIPLARVSLCVLICQNRTRSLHYLGTREVFGSDQFDTIQLSLPFGLYQVKYLFVSLHDVLLIKRTGAPGRDWAGNPYSRINCRFRRA